MARRKGYSANDLLRPLTPAGVKTTTGKGKVTKLPKEALPELSASAMLVDVTVGKDTHRNAYMITPYASLESDAQANKRIANGKAETPIRKVLRHDNGQPIISAFEVTPGTGYPFAEKATAFVRLGSLPILSPECQKAALASVKKLGELLARVKTA